MESSLTSTRAVRERFPSATRESMSAAERERDFISPIMTHSVSVMILNLRYLRNTHSINNIASIRRSGARETFRRRQNENFSEGNSQQKRYIHDSMVDVERVSYRFFLFTLLLVTLILLCFLFFCCSFTLLIISTR